MSLKEWSAHRTGCNLY